MRLFKSNKKTWVFIGIVFGCLVITNGLLYNFYKAKFAFGQSDDVELLIQEGRDFLAAHDIVNANNCFEQAVSLAPSHQVANFFYSVTRILVLIYETEFNDLLDRFGVGAEGRDIYDWTAEFPNKLPSDSPTSGEVIAFLGDTLLPQVEGALDNLEIIDSSFEIILTPDEIDGDEYLEVDYGDILLYKSALNMVKGAISILNGYHLNVDIDDVVNAEDGICDIIHEKVMADLNLLTIKDSGKISNARAAIVQSIVDYLSASDFIRSESDDQWDDFITIEPEDAESERKFRLTLIQVKDSLEGVITPSFSVQLSQFLDLGQFFTNPVNLRELLFGGGVQDILTNHILPQVDRALSNLSGVDEGFGQTLTPEEYPVDENVEVDFGDISSARAVLNAAKSLIKISTVYDMDDVDLLDIFCKVDNDEFCFNDLLIDYSNFLKILLPDTLSEAKTALNDAINKYVVASNFIRDETDAQDNDLITITDYPEQEGVINISTEDEAKFRDIVVAMQNSLSGPTEIPTDDPFTLDLTQFFDEPISLREYIPDFDEECEVVVCTFPDPTFSGILPDYTQDTLANLLHLPVPVSGTITCDSYTSGNIYVAAFDGPDPRYAEKINSASLPSPGPYTLDVDAGEEVWIRAYWDKDGSGTLSPGDYCGSYSGNPVEIISENCCGPNNIDVELKELCEGDFDRDGNVDGSDLATSAADFGRTDCSGDCEGDFDHDGDVDGSDLAVFVADFGRTDCPVCE